MSFRRRLLLIMLAVVVVAQLVTAAATLGTIRRDMLQKGGRELDIVLDVTHQLLEERGNQLRDKVAILASDFAFRSAVATQDTATLVSVLANHGERAGADMVLLTDPQGRMLASSHYPPGTALPFHALWQQALTAGQAVGVVLQDGVPYQFVLLPVRAPNLIGWVGMGFMLDGKLAEEIGQLTRLSVSFMVDAGQPTGASGFVAGSLSQASAADVMSLRQSLASGRYLQQSLLDAASDKLTRAGLLQNSANGRVYAVIQHSRGDLLAVFRALSGRLLGIFALTLLLTAIVAALSARSMAQPLVRLAEAARRIGRGERLTRLPASAHGEVGLLSETLLAMQDNIASRKQTLLYQACHDQLTDLANRHCALQDIAGAVVTGQPFTLLRLAINGFRHINDTFGYATGDRVLTTFADRLRQLPAPLRQAYRLGGDEFLLLLDVTTASADYLIALHECLVRPIELDDAPIRLTLSSGEVSFPLHGSNACLLLRRAEIAMDMAQHTRQRHCRYVQGQDEQHLRQLALVRDLQDAVVQGQLLMVYQPKIDAVSGRPLCFEALMRWQHPRLGFVPPDEFIGLAEQSGHISRLTRWMIRTVCRQLADWERQGRRLNAAINLSAQDVIDPGLPEQLQRALADYGLAPERLDLEITESAIIQDPAMAIRMLERLRQTGLRIAVDDYGTGYSSLAQLRSLPVQELKIDKSFILKLDDRADDRIIVQSTIELGHNLGLEVVAEGVETPASRELLLELGCDYLQGYLIARPLAAERVIEWVNENDRHAITHCVREST